VIVFKNVSVKSGGQFILNDINLAIERREQWAITGSAGSGKTSLAKTLTGELFFTGTILFPGSTGRPRIKLVEQEHRFKDLNNTAQFYYQQRFNASESSNSLKVSDVLTPDNKWIDLLKLRLIYERPLIQLSNGENKRLQLAQALAILPDILILDNPFLGLDTDGRSILEECLETITRTQVQVILITGKSSVPAFVTNVAVLDAGELIFQGSLESYRGFHIGTSVQSQPLDLNELILHSPTVRPSFTFAVKMTNVSVEYEQKAVLKNINWQVRQGECWSLSGPNGAGKSTLLSLVTADNPQAYANEIYLFDRRRGTGETIWDIKRNIGYVSPEMHLYFDRSSTCFEVIASGYFDTIGLFRHLTREQTQLIESWLKVLRLGLYRNTSLRQLSRGQQRMALLGRAMIKNPSLLVLDEPCQGLDDEQTLFFLELVENVVGHFNTTLIYVSHYTTEIPACVTRFLRLTDGRVEEEI
jgi:molybdate transport system ATP-binding protein